MASELKRLISNHRIEELLTATECEILRRAARGNGLTGIAALYGFGTGAAAQREVDRIVAKLLAATGGVDRRSADAASEPPGDSSQAPRPAEASTSRAPAPAAARSPAELGRERHAKILGLLADNAEMSTIDIARAVDIPPGSISGVLGRLRDRGQVTVRADGNRRFYALASSDGPLAHVGELERASAGELEGLENVTGPVEWNGHMPSVLDARALGPLCEAARLEIERIERQAKQLPALKRLLQAAEDCAGL